MKLIYVTLNDEQEARKISIKLLKAELANCTNWFPITCMYNWENKVTEEPEVVLVIKTIEEKFDEIVEVIKSEIDFTNCIAQLNVERCNDDFKEWLHGIVRHDSNE